MTDLNSVLALDHGKGIAGHRDRRSFLSVARGGDGDPGMERVGADVSDAKYDAAALDAGDDVGGVEVGDPAISICSGSGATRVKKDDSSGEKLCRLLDWTIAIRHRLYERD